MQKYEKIPYLLCVTVYFSFLFVSAYSDGDMPKCFLKIVEKWVEKTGWYPDTCVVGLAEGLKNKDLAVKFIEENILED